MSVNRDVNVSEIKQNLSSFLELFEQYSGEIFGSHEQTKLDEIRGKLQRLEPQVTHYILKILGDGGVIIGSRVDRQQIERRNLIGIAVIGGSNELTRNFANLRATVRAVLNGALGNIDSGLWPPSEPEPNLMIRDIVLRQRCFDLLQAPGNFDRVIREATIIIEDRIRNKVSHETLSRLIPQSGDQTGENLINRFFSPKNPIVIFSDNRDSQIAFHKILLGVNAFLRNPHHHRLDDTIEWSWAWSVVGFIDRLLYQIDNCSTSET